MDSHGEQLYIDDLQARLHRWRWIAISAIVALCATVALLAFVGVIAVSLMVAGRSQAQIAEAEARQAVLSRMEADAVLAEQAARLQQAADAEMAARNAEQAARDAAARGAEASGVQPPASSDHAP